MTATTTFGQSTTARHARPHGLELAIMRLGLALLVWARKRADHKASVGDGLNELNDHERFQLHGEATRLRDAAHAERALWHAIG